jgi:Arc/MetJ family transcription regulator
MRTNVDIDDKWMKVALKHSAKKTKKEILNDALELYAKFQLRLQLMNLQGKVKWEGDLDKMRRNG